MTGRSTQPRLICDEMLKRLGHWLRAAGYDVLIASPGESDRSLYQKAVGEARLLITRDRKLAEYRDAGRYVCILHANRMPELVRELSVRLGIDWHYRPFSRCLVCNTPLVEATPAQYDSLPQDVRDSVTHAQFCPRCGQLFWEGSHIRRMRATLDNFSKKIWEFAE